MCKPLPYDDYQWVDEREQSLLDVTSIPNDAPVGYILDCNISYPEHLHHHHSDLPFSPRTEIPPDKGAKFPKLLLTVRDQKRYVIHYVALKSSFEKGDMKKES
ncbi:unnamed protein product [Bemisia tabaci]|uniref:Uncharacterized protein n=1 Tax=Bemisia tabaci TaxID=7038 RepID=A0A9P0F934_BEMTA|nr:unnamed protein product [Bemisia tabaci]